jgi:hypothetical protein
MFPRASLFTTKDVYTRRAQSNVRRGNPAIVRLARNETSTMTSSSLVKYFRYLNSFHPVVKITHRRENNNHSASDQRVRNASLHPRDKGSSPQVRKRFRNRARLPSSPTYLRICKRGSSTERVPRFVSFPNSSWLGSNRYLGNHVDSITEFDGMTVISHTFEGTG